MKRKVINQEEGKMDNVIRTVDLTKSYKGSTVVKDVNLSVKKGEIYGFIGKNGAGKTTTIRMLLNLIKPTSGSVELFGKTITDKNMHDNLRKMGAIIETPGFYMNLSARENLDIHRLMMNISDKTSIDRVLDIVGLSKEGGKKVRNYSLGMRQRLGIARAILHEPEILLLDEPTNGLDPQGVVEIRELLLKIAGSGTTILVSSHILAEVEKIVSSIGILNNGVLLEQISKEDFQKKCKHTSIYKVNDVTKAVALIRQYLNRKDNNCMDNNSIQDNQINISEDTISFTLPQQSENEKDSQSEKQSANGKLNKIMFENDIEVFESKIVYSSLEDYFMELTDAVKIDGNGGIQ